MEVVNTHTQNIIQGKFMKYYIWLWCFECNHIVEIITVHLMKVYLVLGLTPQNVSLNLLFLLNAFIYLFKHECFVGLCVSMVLTFFQFSHRFWGFWANFFYRYRKEANGRMCSLGLPDHKLRKNLLRAYSI